MLRWGFVLWLGLLAGVSACASRSAADRNASRDYSVLTAEEIGSVSGLTTLTTGMPNRAASRGPNCPSRSPADCTPPAE